MKTTNTFLLLVAGLMAGCGNSQTVGSDSAALSDTSAESADVVTSFGEDSGGSTQAFGGASVTLASGPTGARAELAVALRAIAANPQLCVKGSATLTAAADKTAACAFIGNNGSYAGGGTLTFNGCVLDNGGKLDGTVTVDITRALSSGQSCSASASVDVTHEVSFTSLSYTSPSNYELTYSNVTGTVTSTHALNAPPTVLNGTLIGDRQIHDPSGTLILYQSFNGNAKVTLTAATTSTPAMRTIDGSMTVVHHLAKYTATVTMNGVTRVATCCKPIAGTVSVAIAGFNGGARSDVILYGPSCGAVTVDGHALPIAECL
jgi:hypothetical protein